VSIDPDGRLHTVIDWKSDVAPSSALLVQYRAQVAAYVKMAHAERGMVVMVTTQQIFVI
jgi:hypothetical protein